MNRIIGIVGDERGSKSQVAIGESIEHSNKALGLKTTYQWIDTTTLDNEDYANLLKRVHGIWSASGSPFKSLNGVLNSIRYAREIGIPHFGTCGGFQHTIIEYARNVLGYKNAVHEEYLDGFGDHFISKMSCSLVGTKGKVVIYDNTMARKIYNSSEVEVDYFCSYGLNNEFRDLVFQGDLVAGGSDINNEIRIVELKKHPFFMATLYVPQVVSTAEHPDPLITEFVKKVNSVVD